LGAFDVFNPATAFIDLFALIGLTKYTKFCPTIKYDNNLNDLPL